MMLRRCQFINPFRRRSSGSDALFHTASYLQCKHNDTSARLIVPSLGQNSTLILRSQSKLLSQVQIKPQWRDDTLLELVRDADEAGDVSYGPTVIAEAPSTSESSSHQQSHGGMQLTFHLDGIETSLGRVGSFVEVDLLHQQDAPSDKQTDLWKLIATVPEKCNITCQINSDITVDGKLEGDSHLSTSKDANITVGKLRGHNVTLDNTGEIDSATTTTENGDGGTIYIKKAIEARTIQINASQRVRARMINGSDIKIQASPSNTTGDSKLDEDDEGAVLDVGSLYISNGGGDSEAQLNVDATNLDSSGSSSKGIVRVKSNHGHVTINAMVNSNTASSDTPLVDLGGVNGSCDVLIEASAASTNTEQSSDQVANRIHFDAFTPESISTITSRGHVGNTSITIDRKLDAELRLLSVAKSVAALPKDVDAHSFTNDEAQDIKRVLSGLDELVSTSAQRQLDGISIETDTFESNDGSIQSSSSGLQYITGTVKNRSGEPDSRFDVQSRGKINKDGAALQALHGFHSKTKDDSNGAPDDSEIILPLLSVATDGEVKLETLSWLGSIARRYGLEENQNITLGRQASRKPLGWRREWDKTEN